MSGLKYEKSKRRPPKDPALKDPSKGGRRLIPIDENVVRTLARVQCSYAEIAAHFGVDDSTITSRFSDLIVQERQNGKSNIRAKQFQRANAGSDRMLIHLGKNLLGQSDRVEVSQDATFVSLKGSDLSSWDKRAIMDRVRRVIDASRDRSAT